MNRTGVFDFDFQPVQYTPPANIHVSFTEDELKILGKAIGEAMKPAAETDVPSRPRFDDGLPRAQWMDSTKPPPANRSVTAEDFETHRRLLVKHLADIRGDIEALAKRHFRLEKVLADGNIIHPSPSSATPATDAPDLEPGTEPPTP